MGGSKKGKITIRKALEKRDTALFHNIEHIWKKARELQECQRSIEGHQYNPLHCETVESNLGKLISDEEKETFSALELFLLSAAACYHIAGKSDDFDERHALVAMKDIFTNPEKYHLTDRQAKVLSFIVGAYDDEEYNNAPETYPVGNEDVRVRFLSALFRLADVLHTDNSRLPQVKIGDGYKEDEKARFMRLVQGWGITNENQIILTAAPGNIDDVNIIAKGVSMMQKQIEQIAPVLRHEAYPFEIVYACDNRKIKWDAEKEGGRKLHGTDIYTENEAKIFKGRELESEKLLKKEIDPDVSLIIGNPGEEPVWKGVRNEEDISRTFTRKGLFNRSENSGLSALPASGEPGNHGDLQAVREMLKDPDFDVRKAAQSAFGKLVNHDDLQAVREMLKDPDWFVKREALSAFGRLVNHDDLPAVKEMLKDPDWFVKKTALSAFEKLGTHDDLPAVREMLKDPDWFVKKAALSAFGKLGTHDDLPEVRKMLSDTNWFVKREALSAFEKLVTYDDLPAVKEMLKDPDSDVRKAAFSVLEKLVNHDDLQAVREMPKDHGSDVRNGASSLIVEFENLKDLQDISKRYAKGEMFIESSLHSIKSQDEELYSPKKKLLPIHHEKDW